MTSIVKFLRISHEGRNKMLAKSKAFVVVFVRQSSINYSPSYVRDFGMSHMRSSG